MGTRGVGGGGDRQVGQSCPAARFCGVGDVLAPQNRPGLSMAGRGVLSNAPRWQPLRLPLDQNYPEPQGVQRNYRNYRKSLVQ